MIPQNILAIAIMFAVAFIAFKVFRLPVFGAAMMALSSDYNNPEREGRTYSYPVYTGVKIYEGAGVVLDSSGWAKPAVTGTGLITAGRSEEQADNALGQSGDIYVKVKRGVFRYENSTAGDEITKAQIGDTCYWVDDYTVAKTSGTNTRSIAGEIVDVDADGVWVELPSAKISTGGDLVASNNLSEVTAATARANLGANLVALQIPVATLVGTGVYRVVSPVAGTITSIKSVIDGVLTTGDATLTGKIGATAITDGAITITQSGSAAGDVDTCSPSANRTVAAGNVISVTVGGTNATASGAMVTVLIAT